MPYDIIVMACKNNSWCLGPFFHLANKFWPNVRMSLVAESNYFPAANCEFRQLPRKLCTSKGCPRNKFSDSLIYALQTATNKNVLILLADYWFYQPVEAQQISRCSDYMAQHPDVLRTDVAVRPRPNKPFNQINDDLLECAEKRDCFYPISLTPGLWNKDNYLKLLDCNLDPWKTESHSCAKYLKTSMKSLWAEPGSINYFNAQRGGDSGAIVMRREVHEEIKPLIPANMKIFFEN